MPRRKGKGASSSMIHVAGKFGIRVCLPGSKRHQAFAVPTPHVNTHAHEHEHTRQMDTPIRRHTDGHRPPREGVEERDEGLDDREENVGVVSDDEHAGLRKHKQHQDALYVVEIEAAE